jgi:hypothetical protein
MVLALRLPFLNQAIQGDDVNYLYGAEHAQIEPLHPTHVQYVYEGRMVDMRGHPHPPLDVWVLGSLLAVLHDVHEIPFHAAYIVFSLIAASSALALARRFSPHPLLAAALFVVTPAFVVNGTSLESDVPFTAFWLASIALFVLAVDRKSNLALTFSCIAMALAALSAYQAVVLMPILMLYARRDRRALVASLTPLVIMILWQLYERLFSGAVPASVLAGYMQTYGFQALVPKIKNAVALTGHLGWIIFPLLTFATFGRRARFLIVIMIVAAIYDRNPIFWLSIGAGSGVLIWCAEHWRDWLSQWTLVFFAAALAIFFAGSARYLVPIVLPVAVLATQRLSRKTLYAGIALEAALSVCLAIVNYQHWNGYRNFARSLNSHAETKRVWVDGEWGLRYYLESEGAKPLERNQPVRPGEVVVSSTLAYPFKFTTGGGIVAPIATREITSRIPLRLVALNGRSAYSAAGVGLRPFDISRSPIDIVRAETVIERTPTREFLPMNAPYAEQQIVSGIYELENNQWRWMAGKGVLLLKSPAQAEPVKVQLYIPPNAPGRIVRLTVDDRALPQIKYDQPGSYTINTEPITAASATTTLAISVDKTFSVPGDHRELGIILTGAGFEKGVQK